MRRDRLQDHQGVLIFEPCLYYNKAFFHIFIWSGTIRDMSLKLYNTFSRRLEEFDPIDPDAVLMYTCGPTVYKDVHIGNFRTYLTSDVLRRVLLFDGHTVRHIMNITDVGHMRVSKSHGRLIDPILEEADTHGKTPSEIADFYTKQFIRDMKRLNIVLPDEMPHATEYIAEMIGLIEILLKRGFAYETDGNVYFNVRKFSDYGKLSGNTLDKMDQLLEAVRVSTETDKRDSVDFALWKKAEDGRAMSWESPWGLGYPGWHIECSAMAQKLLNKKIDIHSGGEDLVFPHHENEIAQSEAAFGEKFVNYWVHTTYLSVEGEKMSRSKGNIFTLSDVVGRGFSPTAFRYLTYQTHYRMRMNFTWDGMDAAKRAVKKLYTVVTELPEPEGSCDKYESEFYEAINQDLNMPKAVSVMWSMLRSSKYSGEQKSATLRMMDEVLGLGIVETVEEMHTIPDDVMKLVREREHLRRERRFHLADGLRAKIEKMGYVLDDKKRGTKVTRKV